MKKHLLSALALFISLQSLVVAEELPMTAALRPDQTEYLALYRELIETNTTLSVGSCSLAAERMAAHLKAAGYSDSDLTFFSAPEHPKDGGLVAVFPGKKAQLKSILLLGHLDVVEAKREDWSRDPFVLVQENNYFYARGTSDMKAMDAVWVDALVRFKRSGYRPKRTIKLALTCGEETSYAFNGAQWLATNKPELISADFALNEGGGGRTDGHGRLLVEMIQVGEKAAQNFKLETTNVGGHSSIPIRDNAIYQLADALAKIRDYEFPVKFTPTTREFFQKSGAARDDDVGRAMVTLSNNPEDTAAASMVSSDRSYHSMLRTTCVATLLEGGHANNALPQRASANVNCRIFPGETLEETLTTLTAIVRDPGVKITAVPPVRPLAVPPALDPKIIGPAQKLIAKYFPGVPLVPTMSTGATDGIFLEAIGIPVYGAPGGWSDPDGNGTHGLNERRGVRSVFIGRDFLFDLIKTYADAP